MRNALATSCLVLAAAAPGCGPGGGNTPGECTDTLLLPGDLVISEVFADADAPSGGSGADEGKEWFEIYNNSDRPVDLEGLTITHSRPDGTKAKIHVMTPVTLPANDYLVLGNVLPDLVPAWVDYGYADTLGDMFNTDGGKLALSCGTMEIDSATYDMVSAGVSREFDGGGLPDYTANDDLANWCEATPDGADEFDPANFGTPGSPNEDCAVIIIGQCNDGGTMRDTVPPAPGDLVITEVMPSPDLVGDDLGEWFEVLATRDVDLNDLILDRAGDSAGADVVMSEDCLRLSATAPDNRAVFARSADTAMNGGLPAVAGTFRFTLVGGSVGSPGDVQISYGTTVLDSFTWTHSANGVALQVDVGAQTATGNDLEASWCDSTRTYGLGDGGGPGLDNDACPVIVGPGQCLDEVTGLVRDAIKPTTGQVVITEWMPNPTLVSDAAGEWLEIKALAPFDLNGLQVGDTATVAATPVVTASTCIPVATDAHVVFAQGADPGTNGMLPPVAGVFPSGVDLVNTNSTVSVGIDGVALDTKTFPGTSPTGKSIQVDTDGTLCAAPPATLAYNGTDLGTPGDTHTAECP